MLDASDIKKVLPDGAENDRLLMHKCNIKENIQRNAKQEQTATAQLDIT